MQKFGRWWASMWMETCLSRLLIRRELLTEKWRWNPWAPFSMFWSLLVIRLVASSWSGLSPWNVSDKSVLSHTLLLLHMLLVNIPGQCININRSRFHGMLTSLLEMHQGSGFILYRSYLPANVRPGSRLTVMEVYTFVQFSICMLLVSPSNCKMLTTKTWFTKHYEKAPLRFDDALTIILSKWILSKCTVGEQVNDRAQVFVGSSTNNRMFLGTLERWSRNSLTLPAAAAIPRFQLDILVLRKCGH